LVRSTDDVNDGEVVGAGVGVLDTEGETDRVSDVGDAVAVRVNGFDAVCGAVAVLVRVMASDPVVESDWDLLGVFPDTD
jgi:hypothetical protein